MSLLTRKERSLWGLIVFAFPLESSCISFAGFVLCNIIRFIAWLNNVYSLLCWLIGAEGSRLLREVVFLPRKLKHCPRKATARSGNQHAPTSQLISTTRIKNNKLFKKPYIITSQHKEVKQQ